MMSRIQMQIIQGRIEYLNAQITWYKQDYENKFNKIEEKQEKLTKARVKCSELESKISSKEIECSEKQKEIDSLTLEYKDLNKQVKEFFNQSQEAFQKKTNIENQLSSLKARIASPSLTITQLRLDMMKYQTISNQPQPKSIYRIDGEYCMNGIYHCTNHPPREVLINEEEIEKHKKTVKAAQEAIQRLSKEISRLEMEYADLQQEYEDLNNAFDLAKGEYENLQTELTSKQKQVAENKQASNLAEATHGYLLQEKSNLTNELTSVQNEALDSQREIASLEWQLANIQNNIGSVTQELEQEQEKYARFRRGMLEQLAQQEFMREENASSKGTTIPNNSNFKLLDALKQIAQREIDNEDSNKEQNNNQSIHASSESLSDRLMDSVVDIAHDVGAINKQVKDNLKIIKSFGNNLVDNIKHDFEKVDEIFNPNNNP